jgi:hypothetical protein
MMDEMQWKPGDIIVYRGASPTRIWYAVPAFVVHDTEALLALYWPVGTCGKWRLKAPGKRVEIRDIVESPMDLVDNTWIKTDILVLITPGAAHAIYVMWEERTRRFLCWYANLQDPIRRTEIGFDTGDHILDVVFEPDHSGWRWKDEDELREAVTLEIFTEEAAARIRAEGERVIRMYAENYPPFCAGWEKWSPPVGWGKPVLPDGWDTGY